MARLAFPIFGILAILAAAIAIACIESLPDAIASYDREPEDVYLRFFWLLVSLLLGIFWAHTSIQGLKTKRFLRRGTLSIVASSFAALLGILMVASAFFGYYIDEVELLGGSLLLASSVVFWILSREQGDT